MGTMLEHNTPSVKKRKNILKKKKNMRPANWRIFWQ